MYMNFDTKLEFTIYGTVDVVSQAKGLACKTKFDDAPGHLPQVAW